MPMHVIRMSRPGVRLPRSVTLFPLVALLLSLHACGGGDDDAGAPASQGTRGSLPSGTLTIFAAASLTDAFEEIAATLEDEYPDLSIEQNFGGSQQLVTQLAEGADADVFASANVAQMDVALEAEIVDGFAAFFARNRLVIVVPSDNPRGVEQPEDLATDGLKLVMANESVPVGAYALDMLDMLSGDPSNGAGFRERVIKNVVSYEDNVKQVVAKVQLGEADAGIVYRTDAAAAGDAVRTIDIPDQYNVIAEYPIAPVAEGDAALAELFIDFLLSDVGQGILNDYGFAPLE